MQTRGPGDEIVSILFCYAAMVFGMMAEYGYAQAERGHKKIEFDLMSFMLPIFTSPIVFIPLLTLTSEVAIGGAFTRPKMMVYLMAMPIIISAGIWGLRYPAMGLEWLFPKIINVWRVILGLPTRP